MVKNLQAETDTIPEKNKPLLGTPAKRSSILLTPPRPGEQSKTVMVLGVERGGTSMVAGILRALGVNMGDRVGFNHEDPRFMVEDTEVLQRRIQMRNKQEAVWGFKMPKQVQHLDFFEQNLRNPYYIVVLRNLLAIADSWRQRGSGDVLGSLDRTFNYYHRIIEHCKKSSRPVLMLNYERAVGNAVGKEEAVRAIGEFLGVDVDDKVLARATAMITGDGKGYLNLPEHFFAVTATQAMPPRPPVTLDLRTPELVGSLVEFDTMDKKLTYVPQGSDVLPQNFWLKIDLDADRSIDLSTCPLRVYFNYTGAYYPAHCARPPIKRGTNHFYVETSGRAAGLAFGPLQVPSRLSVRAEAFEAAPEDDAAAYGAIADNLSRPDAKSR
jgi:hypothetical protein